MGNNKKAGKRLLSGLLLIIALFSVFVLCDQTLLASDNKTEKSALSGDYELYIDDEADLLSPEEESALEEVMTPITAFGNVAFLSIDQNSETAEAYCKSFYKQRWGKASGTAFLIDMDNRKIWIHSDGAIYKVITKSYANTITDNAYSYASDGDYYGCASLAFTQIYTLLTGSKIAQPMKYITNALLALIISSLLIFIYIRFIFVMKAPSDDEILEHIAYHCKISNISNTFTKKSKVYNPPSSSDSSSSSGGSSGGGGGGGSSGGGGGHSF